jgi:hypothetical protein
MYTEQRIITLRNLYLNIYFLKEREIKSVVSFRYFSRYNNSFVYARAHTYIFLLIHSLVYYVTFLTK